MIKTNSFTLATYQKGNPDSKKLALVLPGKLDTKDYAHMRSHVDFLANLGFFALSFDPPGTWESPGDISLYTTTNYLKAIDELIEYFGNKPTFLVGHSRGGSMAMLAGMRNSKVLAFAAAMSYVYDKNYQGQAQNEEWKKKGYWESARDLPPGGGPKTKIFKLPYSFQEDQKKYDMVEDIKKSKKPKLYIAGAHDQLVSAEKVREEFELAADPKQFTLIHSVHDYRLEPIMINNVNMAIEHFLQEFWK